MIRASVLAAGLLCCCGSAMATPVVFSGSSGNLSASASFDVSGTTMTVVLTNTSVVDVLTPPEVLTALFFHIDGPTVNFTPVSAVITAGSTTIYAPFPAVGVVGGEWAYADGISQPAPLAGLNYGISSSGLAIFGSASFPGANLAGPGGVDGLQFGITSAGDNSATGNGGITGSDGLVRNSVTFTFTCPAGFDPNTITDTFFLYGTAVGENGFHHPAPGAAALLGLGGIMAARRKRA